MVIIQTEQKLLFEEVLSTKSKCKILKYLALEGEMNISRIVQQTGLNHLTAKKDLEFLNQIGFIQEKQFGRIKIYRFKDENSKANALKHLINYWECDVDDN